MPTYNRIASYAVLIVAIALVSILFLESKTSAAPSSVTIQTTATATTTVAFLGVGVATSTYQFDNPTFSSGKIPNMQPIDQVNLYVQLAASSTASVLTITPQFSNNGIDWYGFNQVGTVVLSTGVSTAATSSLIFQWNPGTTATTSNVFTLPAIAAQHERVQFSASGAAAAVYAEVDLKRSAAGSQ